MKILTIISLFVITLVPSQAWAVETERTHIEVQGSSVYAEWSYVEGDIVTFMSLFITDKIEVLAGTDSSKGPLDTRSSTLVIFRTNQATGDVLITGVGLADGDDFELTISEDLSTAHFVADMIFLDEGTFTTYDFVVDLTWTATGSLERNVSIDHFNEQQGFVLNSHSIQNSREAVSTGSMFGRCIHVGLCVIPSSGEEFVTVPSTNALIVKEQAGVN